eukprot:1157247-Pelagomonas_calceolata.AAC.14
MQVMIERENATERSSVKMQGCWTKQCDLKEAAATVAWQQVNSVGSMDLFVMALCVWFKVTVRLKEGVESGAANSCRSSRLSGTHPVAFVLFVGRTMSPFLASLKASCVECRSILPGKPLSKYPMFKLLHQMVYWTSIIVWFRAVNGIQCLVGVKPSCKFHILFLDTKSSANCVNKEIDGAINILENGKHCCKQSGHQNKMD